MFSTFKHGLVNADGSVDVYFGPKASAGKEINWIQTIPDNGWDTLLTSKIARQRR